MNSFIRKVGSYSGISGSKGLCISMSGHNRQAASKSPSMLLTRSGWMTDPGSVMEDEPDPGGFLQVFCIQRLYVSSHTGRPEYLRTHLKGRKDTKLDKLAVVPTWSFLQQRGVPGVCESTEASTLHLVSCMWVEGVTALSTRPAWDVPASRVPRSLPLKAHGPRCIEVCICSWNNF